MKIFLHGFLQNPQQWESIVPKSEDVLFYNLWKDVDKLPNGKSGFDAWIDLFYDKVPPGEHEIYGYSLGGRLALHAVAAYPKLWKKVVVFSTNPGIAGDDNKASRIGSDLQWGRRFQQEDWKRTIDAWNTQGVFAGEKNPTALQEKDFSKPLLAKALDVFSLGRQKNLLPKLTELPKQNSHWVVGERDEKYMAIAQELPKNLSFQVSVVPNHAHRIPWGVENTATYPWHWS